MSKVSPKMTTPPEFDHPSIRSCPVINDLRGAFIPAFDATNDPFAGRHEAWCLQNFAISEPGTLRGMHYQEPLAQAKLITVIQGAIQDVVVDQRSGSTTFNQIFSFDLNSESTNQIFIPRGFAHGFLVVSPNNAIISYLADAPFSPADEGSFAWDSPNLKPIWQTLPNKLSSRDQSAPPREALG